MNDVTGDFYCPSGFSASSFSFPIDHTTIVGSIATTGTTCAFTDVENETILIDKYKEVSSYKSKSAIYCPVINDGNIALLVCFSPLTNRNFQANIL